MKKVLVTVLVGVAGLFLFGLATADTWTHELDPGDLVEFTSSNTVNQNTGCFSRIECDFQSPGSYPHVTFVMAGGTQTFRHEVSLGQGQFSEADGHVGALQCDVSHHVSLSDNPDGSSKFTFIFPY